MLAFMSIHFEQTDDGWVAQSGKYQMRREGLRVGERFFLFANGKREASLFAWVRQLPDPDGPEYRWTLGTSYRTAETRLGFETYATLFGAFLDAYQSSLRLPPGRVVIVFDPEIERKAWDEWGP